MFEKALITRAGGQQDHDQLVDLGLLAETVFFYGSTHLLLSRTSICSLATQVPHRDLLALLDCGHIRLSYLSEGFGVVTSGPLRAMGLVAMVHRAKELGRGRVDYKDETSVALERALGASAETTALINSLCDRLVLFEFRKTPENKETITALAYKDLHSVTFLRAAARTVLSHLVPSYVPPTAFRFDFVDTGRGFLIDTDLDFKSINAEYDKRVPATHSTVTTELLLAHMLDARVESYFAAHYMADLVAPSLHSDIIRIKHFDFLRSTQAGAAQREQFSDVVLDGFPSIREVINDESRSISDFLHLLDKAEKFKAWLQQVNPDRGLLAEYHRKVTEETWADRLPVKSVRFAIATGIGYAADALVGAGAGMAVGALDALYLDKLLRGWRPNHFIDGPYRTFVTPPV